MVSNFRKGLEKALIYLGTTGMLFGYSREVFRQSLSDQGNRAYAQYCGDRTGNTMIILGSAFPLLGGACLRKTEKTRWGTRPQYNIEY